MGTDIESRIVLHQGASVSRKLWVWTTWALTWYIPSYFLKKCGGMKNPSVRFAWREKLALFTLFTCASCILLLFIIGIPRLVCPKQNIKSLFDVEAMNKYDAGTDKRTNAYVAAYGRYYEITDIVKEHIEKIGADDTKMQKVLGRDVSEMFYPTMDWDGSCPGITNPGATWDNLLERDPERMRPHQQINEQTKLPQNFLGILGKYSRGRIGWTKKSLTSMSTPKMKPLVMYGKVYNIAAYFKGQTEPGFFDKNMWNIFSNAVDGQDVTGFMETLRSQNPIYYRNVVNCMDHIFYIGVIDERDALKCTITDSIMLGASAIICVVLGIKFLAAFVSGDNTNPSQLDRYVIIQVPCYTENRKSLELTLNSIASARFSDNHKLAVVLCDGMIRGEGNAKTTPDIVLEILYGSEERVKEEKEKARSPMSYHAVGEGRKAENKAQIYSGKYECEGHKLPFIVVVKTGLDNEKYKPGNRGKRDSQICIMRFLSNIYGNNRLTEFEYGMYHEMKNVIGVHPKQYEFILMVDADTYITKDSIVKMVYHMIKDENTVALSGETLVANENESWAARIQVYEYFISHHLAKAFESMFGSVTCLPGCFSMYRLRTEKEDTVLISPALIEDYAEANVDTLHKKNLLHLGEDRYLTTLMLKHFREMSTRYTQDAQCYTNVPNSFGVLKSQRRRWINSTIHNLLELVNLQQLCGFCCFSMRFLVFLDLISTMVAPAAVGYVGYIIFMITYNSITGDEQIQAFMVSIFMIAAIYGLQLIILIVKMKWAFFFYMLFYIIAMPYFSFYLPLYSFWHMDDFNWGNTRVVVGGGKDDDVVENFDHNRIPRKTIKEWESTFKDDNMDDELAFKDCARSIKFNRTDVDNYPYAPQMMSQPQSAFIPYRGTFSTPAMSVYGGSQHGGVMPVPPPSVYGGAPPPPSVYGGAPPPPSVYGGAPPPPSVYGGAPPPPSVYGGAPPPPSVYGGAPPPPSVYGGAPPPPSVYGGAPPPSVYGDITAGKPHYIHQNTHISFPVPSHVASYVGTTYPLPSTYAPSSYDGATSVYGKNEKDEDMDQDEYERQKLERREKRRQRRLEKELKKKRDEVTQEATENTSKKSNASPIVSQQYMSLPVLEQNDGLADDWGILSYKNE